MNGEDMDQAKQRFKETDKLLGEIEEMERNDPRGLSVLGKVLGALVRIGFGKKKS